jgi:hypothetical protein
MSNPLEPYLEEVAKDLKIDQFNVKEVQLRSPSRKHYWVARLINTKIKLNALKNKKKALKNRLIQKILDNAPTKLSMTAASNAADNSKDLEELTQQIDECEIVVEYLDNVVKIMSNLHWEIKNIIELMQMETQ